MCAKYVWAESAQGFVTTGQRVGLRLAARHYRPEPQQINIEQKGGVGSRGGEPDREDAMDREWGSKPGSGGAASAQNEAIDRRERLRRLALETIDLAKDPYFMRNHLGR